MYRHSTPSRTVSADTRLSAPFVSRDKISGIQARFPTNPQQTTERTLATLCSGRSHLSSTPIDRGNRLSHMADCRRRQPSRERPLSSSHTVRYLPSNAPVALSMRYMSGIRLSSVRPSMSHENEEEGGTRPLSSTGASPPDSDHSNHAHKQTPSKKPVCDPYGLDNKPLADEEVQFQLEMMLSPGWSYNTTQHTLHKTYAFPKVSRTANNIIVTPLAATVPGQPSGPRHGAAACFVFAEAISNVSVNNDHWPYNIHIIPRRCEVEVTLKTVGRPGVTYADFNLANLFDNFYETQMIKF